MKHILNPSILFLTWFFLISIISSLLYDINVQFINFGILIIVLIPVFLGYFFALPLYPSGLNYSIQIKPFEKVFYMSLIFWSFAQLSNIFSLIQYFDIINPAITKDLVTNVFYENEGLGFKESGKGFFTIINTLFYILGFPSLILGSLRLTLSNKKTSLLPLFFGALSSLVSFSRFHMFVYLSIYFLSFFCFKIMLKQKIKLGSNFILGLSIILLLFGIPAFLRSGGESWNLLSPLNVYLFGGYAAFIKWIQSSPLDYFYFGNLNGTSFYSLKTWLAYTGIVDPPSNLHYEFVDIGSKDSTNVYSLFRPIIEDFGLVFLPFILFVFSFCSSWVYRKLFVFRSLEYLPVVAFSLTFSAFLFYTSIFSDFRIFIGSCFTVSLLKSLYVKIPQGKVNNLGMSGSL